MLTDSLTSHYFFRVDSTYYFLCRSRVVSSPLEYREYFTVNPMVRHVSIVISLLLILHFPSPVLSYPCFGLHNLHR